MARHREVDVWIWDVGGDFHKMSVEMSQPQLRVSTRKYWQPKTDVIEMEGSVVVVAEIAGVQLADVTLEFEGTSHFIRIRGSRLEPVLPSGCRTAIYQLEILYGDFEREVPLPRVRLNPSRAQATLKDGLLFIQIPKAN